MTKSIVITGVSGFIGSHVAREAMRRGYNITGVDRRRDARPEGFQFIEADIRDRDRMMQLIEGKDCVLHLAAVTSNVEFMATPADCYDINVNGFLNILHAAAETGCKRLVYASSAAVYEDDFAEDAVLDFKQPRNHYAKSKMMNEMMAQSYADLYDLRTTGLRYFNVYGNGENEKGDYASIVTIFLRAKKHGEPLVVYGDGTQARDLINATDAASITLDLLEKGTSHLYNVGTGVSTAYSRIAEMIGDKRAITYVPNPLSSYQLFTRAETTRLNKALSNYRFLPLERGIERIRV